MSLVLLFHTHCPIYFGIWSQVFLLVWVLCVLCFYDLGTIYHHVCLVFLMRSAKLSSTNNSRSTAHGYAVKHALSAMPKDPAESETAATWQHHSVLVKLKSFTSMPNFFTNNRNCNRCRTQPPSLPSSNARFITLRCMASFARANLERFHPPPSDSPCPVQPPRL